MPLYVDETTGANTPKQQDEAESMLHALRMQREQLAKREHGLVTELEVVRRVSRACDAAMNELDAEQASPMPGERY